jgi:F-type H+-transporting ATPase subunit epsilon
MSLTLKIITPVRTVFEEDGITSLTVPTQNGQITILPNHLPLITKVVLGELTIKKGNQIIEMVVTDGFLKLEKDGRIEILSDYAVRNEEIEIAKVQEAKKRAEEAMKEKKSESDFAIAEAQLRRTLMELKVATRKHGLS